MSLHPIIADVFAAHGMPTPDTYRGWPVFRGRWPEPEWSATGPNYDASWEGEEDGWVASGGHVHGATRDALIAEIDAWIEENEV